MTDLNNQQTDQVISSKVTTSRLDKMYNNFVRITDWVINGKASKYSMPKALAWLFDTTEVNQSEINELKSLISTLQGDLVNKEQKITALDNTLKSVNASLADLVQTLNNNVPAPAPAPAPAEDELADLDDAVPSSPNEQAIKVSAEAVNAGDIDPTSYAALDAEISNLLQN